MNGRGESTRPSAAQHAALRRDIWSRESVRWQRALQRVVLRCDVVWRGETRLRDYQQHIQHPAQQLRRRHQLLAQCTAPSLLSATLQHGTTRCNTAPQDATRHRVLQHDATSTMRCHVRLYQTPPSPTARSAHRALDGTAARTGPSDRPTCETTCVGVISPKPVAASHNSRLLTGAFLAAAHSGVRGATKSGRARTARKDHAAPHTRTGACAHTRMHTHSSPH